MTSHKLRLDTRPFQCLWTASSDLLALAKPYYVQISKHKAANEGKPNFDGLPADVWRKEKSLSIAAFLTSYAGLEAFVNIAFDHFKVREPIEIPEDLFPEKLAQSREKFIHKDFTNWRLDTRVYFLVTLCSDPIKSPKLVFDLQSSMWMKFQEVTAIRRSYHHAKSENIFQTATKVGPKKWAVNDSDSRNFWPETGTPRDHRILNYESANVLNGTIFWIVEQLFIGLDGKLTTKFLREETMQIID